MANKWYSKPPPGSLLDTTHPLSQGLVGLWLFNEGGGGTAYDLSGQRNHGTLTNMANPPTQTSGWCGGGLSFDGVDDYVDCGNPVSLNITGTITVSAWVNITSQKDYAPIILKGYAGLSTVVGGYMLRLNPSGKMLFRIATTISTYEAESSAISFSTWHYVVGVYDHTNVSIYVDGVKTVGDTCIQDIKNSSYNLEFGRDAYSSLRQFGGIIDDVRIYNRALSAAEVRQLYIEPYCMIKKSGKIVYFLPSTFVYDETNKLQVITVAGSETDTANRLDTNKLQVISVAQIESDTQAMIESGKTQIVSAITASSDLQSMNELNKLQGVSVFQNITDIITANELDKLETIIVAQSELDTLTASELNKVQVILVIQTETDVLITIKIYDETGKVQTILVVQGKIDAITANEVGKSEIIAVEQSELDALMANEVDSLQIIAVEQSTSDSLVANEIYKIQEIQVIQSNTEHLIMDELGNEQIIVATQSATDILNGNELGKLCRILVVTDETDTQNMIETGKIVTIVCSESEVDYLINGDLARRFAGKKPYFSYTGEKPNKVTSGKKPYFKFTL
jgi:hypothetical protein